MKYSPYESRQKAGEVLAEFILKFNNEISKTLEKNPTEFFLFAIPNGGVPVAEFFCQSLKIKYDLLIVRKLKIPYNTEAGFGSVTTDGTVLINESLLPHLNLSKEQIDMAIQTTKIEIQGRINFYHKKNISDDTYREYIYHKYIFMMDDGLASGFTMLAAIKMIKKYHPKEIYLAIPTAPLHTVNKIEKEVSRIFCPNIREARWFAVADAYKHWYDIPDSEVLEILKESQFYIENG
jgi:putative phosphoribosyl transferase